MMGGDYAAMHDARLERQAALAASVNYLHTFFQKSRPPSAPLSEEDMTLFMLLVTYSDALDALPPDLTRSFSDLRELDAVLGCVYDDLSMIIVSKKDKHLGMVGSERVR